jgi:ATP-dependent DNA helicase
MTTPGSDGDTPVSSPPPSGDGDMNDEDHDDTGAVSKAMREEEAQMRAVREKQEAERDAEVAEQRRQEFAAMDAKETDGKFKALEYLLSQSQLYSSIMLQQMQKQEQAEDAKDARSRRRAEKREVQAEKQAEVSQRRATTRAAAGVTSEAPAKSPVKTLPSRGKAKNPRNQASIASFFKKSDLEAKAGKGANVAEALQEAAEESNKAGEEDDGIKADSRGFDNLRSARQPASVTGGTMRAYQLEGLEWLTSLYENGLNGILADEMGLGKTIQTISFLAFLREQGVFGPFLISAPLSTTANWVNEFEKWTPDIPVILYHGSKQEREQMRRKHFKRPGSDTFPVIVTSYEICMNDRKWLANLGWKFIIIVSAVDELDTQAND